MKRVNSNIVTACEGIVLISRLKASEINSYVNDMVELISTSVPIPPSRRDELKDCLMGAVYGPDTLAEAIEAFFAEHNSEVNSDANS